MYRLFIAIDPPEDVRDQLKQICYGLPSARWFDEDQLHITLRFLGEVDGGVFADIRQALAEVSAAPFKVTIKGVGYFPPRQDPKHLWAGIEKNDQLNHLRNKIESTLVRAGLPAEGRKFVGHITLARLKDTPASKVAPFLQEFSLFRLPPFPVTQFCLYSSYLSSERALHQVEATFPLVGTGNENL